MPPSAAPQQPLYTYIFVLGSFYNFMLGLSLSCFALYPLFVENNGGDLSTVGVFMGVFWFAAMLGRPIHGAMIDAWGVRWVLLMAAACISLPCLGFMASLEGEMTLWVFLLRIIQGFGWGAHMSAFFTLVGQNAPAGRNNEAVAMYGMSGMVGGAFGAFIGERIIDASGLFPFFAINASFGFAAIVVTMMIPRSSATDRRDRFTLHGIRTVAVMPRFRMVYVMAICHAAAYATFANFITVVMTIRDIESFSLFFTMFSISGVTIRILGSHWADRYGYIHVMLPGFLAYTLGLVVLQFSGSLFWVLVAGLFCGIGHGITFPIVISLGYVLSPERYRGSGMALITGMFDVGNGICALVLGLLGYWFGYQVVFLAGAAFPAVASVAIAIYGRSFTENTLQPFVTPSASGLQEERA